MEGHFLSADETIRDMIERQVVCGASWAYVTEKGFRLCYRGRRGAVSPYDMESLAPGMVYDLASLSKVVGTASRVLQLCEEKRLRLDTPVRQILKAFRFSEVTVGNLLLHNSGLMAELVGKESLTKENIVDRVFETPMEFSCGGRFLYSDTGYILLGMIIRELDRTSLEESLKSHVFLPLHMGRTSYATDPGAFLYVPTESTGKRGIICGTVHDSKAYLLGESGSAGLFSTLDDLAVFAGHYLRRSEKLFRPETFKLIMETNVFGRTYGWSREYGNKTLYHTGFTGTSMLLDMEHRAGMVLLTNRIHPTREQVEFFKWRERINRLFLEDGFDD